MAIAQTIIDQVNNGMGPEELARKNPWKELTGVNLNELLKIAVNMEEKQHSYNLLVYLFRVSFDKDLWFSTEVLSQAVQHPIMTLLDRQAILPSMRSHLNKIKDQITTKPPTEEKLVKYWLMEANYYAVNGNLLAETGDKVEAAQNYKIAQSIFEQLGQFQQASKYKVLSWRIQGNEIQKIPLAKTSPIKFRLPPTKPFNQAFPAETENVEQKPESQKPTTILNRKKVETAKEKPAPAAELPPAEAEIASPPQAKLQEEQVKEEQAAPVSLQQADVSSAFLPQGESLPSSEYYYPLPDVWMKDGQLHILGIEKLEGDETLRIKKQIEQECDILMGVQLLSQMYLVRRNVLEREVKRLERKANILRQRIDRLEKKTGKLENPSK